MKKISIISILAASLISFSACSDSDDNGSGQDTSECSASQPCPGGKTCVNGQCIVKPATVECDAAKPCPATHQCVNQKCIPLPPKPECSDTDPCKNGKICENNKCVEPECSENKFCMGEKQCVNHKCVDPECGITIPCANQWLCVDHKCVEPECSSIKPCAGGLICENNKCIEPECSDSKPCTGGLICKEGKCRPDKACVSSSECGEGSICDNYLCVPADSCSFTHTCPDKKICHEGKCLDEKPRTQCDREKPCTESGTTCVAGKCVKCSCAKDETCTEDGKCIKTADATVKKMKAGDPCKWNKDFSFCDNNRLFSCSQDSGEASYTVKVKNCGGNICSTSPTDGLNCYEPCPVEEDFYGECLDDYNSMDGYSTGISFKTHCTPSVEGPLIWTFTEGYEICNSGCFNGSCLIKPKEHGQTCTQTSFQDACLGSWSSWCSSDDNQAGIVIGENCNEGFIKDADKFHCTFTEDGYTDCVTDCTTLNEEKNFCHTTLSGDSSSDTRICLKDNKGRLGYFLTERQKCTGGCNPKTGKCN